ncbi:MAG: hypothetical protein Q8R17_02605 [bacterium]|nr:hypothetical protein [bacterium]
MVHLRYALKRDGRLSGDYANTLSETASMQYQLEKGESELGFSSPRSEVKKVIVVVLPRWIARFIKDRV